MKARLLGDLPVSIIGLGCNNFGRALDAAGSAAVVHAALDAGITFFDTADNYGGGQSESFLGRALAQRRHDVVIATKFGLPVPGVPGSGGAAGHYVVRALERSLRQLGTDYVDHYQLHKPDPSTPIEETLEALDRLVAAGKVRQIGSCNLDPDQIIAAEAAAAASGGARFRSVQIEFSLLHRGPQVQDVLTVSRRFGLGVIPFYPLASGVLTGKVCAGQTPTGRLAMDRYQRFLTPQNFAAVERLRFFCTERGRTPGEAAIAWLLANQPVTTVIAGATSAEQVRANAAAADWQMDPAEAAEVARVTGGGAP